ncbi:c-type cytochrome [Caldithrix abyssi]
MKKLSWIIGLFMFVLLLGCRGQISEKPPIHPVPDMDDQPKFKAQEENRFFTDGSAMRVPVPGTVARGEYHENEEYFTGKDENGKPIDYIPEAVTLALLKRGQERYNIYCAPCHSRVGDGLGMVVKRGFPPPPSFHQDNIRAYADGHIFDVISNGIRNMPAYKHQIPVKDRWAIVAYFRALQRSQHATIKDVPEELRDKIK